MKRWYFIVFVLSVALSVAGCQEATPVPIADTPSALTVSSHAHQAESI